MFNIFRSKNDTATNTNSDQQALIVSSNFESGEEYGAEDELKEFHKLEDVIRAEMEKNGIEYDGHDIGEGTFTMYLYGSDSDHIFEQVKPLLNASIFKWFDVTLQYGPPENPNTKEKKLRYSAIH